MVGAGRKTLVLQLEPRRTGSPAPIAGPRVAAVLSVILLACTAGPPDDGPGVGPSTADLAGSWRAVLLSPGGELPFTLRFAAGAGTPPAVAVNGDEVVPFTSLRREPPRLVLRIDGYDSEIEARLSQDGRVLEGRWGRTTATGRSQLGFRATRGELHRFAARLPEQAAGADRRAIPTVSGIWAAHFVDDDGEEPARAEFRQEGTRVTGTFLTPTGDYRYLEGDYRAGYLRLSAFDGGHAFLFHARAMQDGTLAGDFWSRDTYHATWTARPASAAESEAILPDPFSEIHLTNPEGRFAFRFADLDGRPVSLSDARFRGKVVMVNLFGSWCPNCNDEAPLLAAWHRRYRERGLEIVGLAYEYTGDTKRDWDFVRRFAVRHGIEYPLLLAGTSDKTAAGATLPDLSAVKAYPTTLFVGRDGRVRKIHSGFAGPATGEHHRRLVDGFESLIEELLAEPAPESS